MPPLPAQAPKAYSPVEVATLRAGVDRAELGLMIMEAQLFVACLDQRGPAVRNRAWRGGFDLEMAAGP
jgi:hypothetical protein